MRRISSEDDQADFVLSFTSDLGIDEVVRMQADICIDQENENDIENK